MSTNRRLTGTHGIRRRGYWTVRTALTLAAATALSTAVATRASATGPVRAPFVLPPEVVYPAGVVCPFAVRVTWPVNREVSTTFSDDQGNPTRMLVTGHLVLEVTNLATRETKRFNISGPGTVIFESDQGFAGSITIIARGPIIQPFLPTDSPSSAFLGFDGLTVLHVSAAPEFKTTLVRSDGPVTDICAEVS
jgi:hypothetical protein